LTGHFAGIEKTPGVLFSVLFLPTEFTKNAILKAEIGTEIEMQSVQHTLIEGRRRWSNAMVRKVSFGGLTMLTTLPSRVSAMFADPIQTVFRELERDFPWSDSGMRKVGPLSVWDDASAVHIQMDVPGVPLEDLDVSVEKGRLTIRGERKAPDRSPEYLHEERCFGQFERNIMLNDWVDSSAVEATLHDGVLCLKLAKRPEAQPQKIAIRNGADSKRLEAS
jgi:HSP20 family protein